MQKQILISLLIGFSVTVVSAQQSLMVATPAMSADRGADKIYYANQNEPPRAIEFKARTITASYFVANINTYLGLSADFTFTEVESNGDQLSMHHRLLQQYYNGIPIEGMSYRVHERDGFITSANGKAVRNMHPDLHTNISEQQAFAWAKQYVNTKDTTTRVGKKLIVSKGFTFAPESFVLAFQFDIDVSLIERWRISIDAHNGQIVNKVTLVNTCFNEAPKPQPYATATAMTSYYGKQGIRVDKSGDGSRLVGQTEHGGNIGTYDFHHASVLALYFGLPVQVYDIYSADNTYNGSGYKAAVSAQWATEQAYEYYFKKHNRNSFDNKGGTITSYVHVDQNLNNAFWTNGVLAFGDGSANNPLVELDVVSHELTHGVTQYEAQLQYYGEYGALNESFSDIMGKAVEFYTFGDTATWQIASHFINGGLRDFSNPNLQNQADTYAGDMWYDGYEDNGGVHSNSGVQNFWFYLLCNGGTGINDHAVNYAVESIGMDNAVNITYRNLTEYLGYFSDYLDCRIGSLLATADIYGKHSNAYQQVDKAWDAVGVIDEPIITSLDVYDITATTVKLKGTLLPRGDTVSYHFEYGTTPTFGKTSKSYNYTEKVEGTITGLQSQTKYYLRLVATNEHGKTYSAITEFTTISLAPLVKIRQAIDVTETTATFRGQINPNSLAGSFYFEYGLTPAFGIVSSTYNISDTTEYIDIAAPIAGLQPRQTYYYRLVATNNFTTIKTKSLTLFTAIKPSIISCTPNHAQPGTQVVITGQNFNALPEKNVVAFGATRGEIVSGNSTELKVTVPAGASLGTITVLDVQSQLQAESTQEFIPTFTGEFDKNSIQLAVGSNTPAFYRTWIQDMDGDNKPDIVGVHYEGFSILQNVNAGGQITEASFLKTTISTDDAYFASDDFYLIDFDGNGLKDVIGRSENGLSIYPNLSLPGYLFFGPPLEVESGSLLGNLIFADFDQDGRIDVAGTMSLPGAKNSFTLFRNQNSNGFLPSISFSQENTLVLPYIIEFMSTGDINNDGKPDVIIGAEHQTSFSVLVNKSNPGMFEFEENIQQDESRSERYVQYHASDLNRDGLKDLFTDAPYLPGNVNVIESVSSVSGIEFAKPFMLLDSVQSTITPGDINGDGKIDLIAGFSNRRFALIQNNINLNASMLASSFEKIGEYGTPIINAGSGDVNTDTNIGDLNGDGRPEIIHVYAYNYGPHDGYNMEIWQNIPNKCAEPSLIKIQTSQRQATIIAPPNTSLSDFEISYAYAPIDDNTYWSEVTIPTISYLTPGYAYQLRVRGTCDTGFTDYYYIDFITECIDLSTFYITNIGKDFVSLNTSNLNLNSVEVQYSPAGQEIWTTVPQYVSIISNLLPGTMYDLRYRGRCNTTADFTYRQFTTLCPGINKISISSTYNTALVSWTSDYFSTAVLEYSSDQFNWNLIDKTQTMSSLIPGQKYFVRGKMSCPSTGSDFSYASFYTLCPQITKLNVDEISPFSARINWVDQTNTNQYLINYSQHDSSQTVTKQTKLTSLVIDGLTPGTSYSVSVAAQCTAAPAYSTAAFSTICYEPYNLTASLVSPATAVLSWEANFTGQPYVIDYAITNSNHWLSADANANKFQLTNLQPGTEYEARVHITCLSVTEPYVSLHFATGVYDATMCAPNPTENTITIYPSRNLIGSSFSIYDNMGREAGHGVLIDYIIDLSDFATGLYTVRIDGEKPMKVVKR